jgi:uncharacterized repeat protein (TIGR03837 family)
LSTWDIFCKVIDNFGDAGVCWRLGLQLAEEHGQTVRLWVDRPETLMPLLSATQRQAQEMGLGRPEICQWHHARMFEDPADVVIEAFGCALPESCLAAMAARPAPPCWINLEYLSAEAWVEDCHAKPSPHPRLPLVKHFFFPGFTAKTGGLLRESTLSARRQTFREAIGREGFLAALGLEATPETLLVSLFCYDTAPIRALIDAWREDASPLLCLIPLLSNRSLVLTEREKNCCPQDDAPVRIVPIPFLSQVEYDTLLWACDLNFVRGEDSFVRAQWAEKPFVWQIYPQEDGAHLKKLAAFQERYTALLPPAERETLGAFWQAWNGPADDSFSSRKHPALTGRNLTQNWRALRQMLPRLKAHGRTWSRHLQTQEDLATALVTFCGSIPAPHHLRLQ